MPKVVGQTHAATQSVFSHIYGQMCAEDSVAWCWKWLNPIQWTVHHWTTRTKIAVWQVSPVHLWSPFQSSPLCLFMFSLTHHQIRSTLIFPDETMKIKLPCWSVVCRLQDEVFQALKMARIGRVRSIVNYDKTYGVFLRGFANICAVSKSVIYDRALLWWSAGTLVELTNASVADIDPNGNRLMPFRFFFLSPSPFSTSSSLSQHQGN